MIYHLAELVHRQLKNTVLYRVEYRVTRMENGSRFPGRNLLKPYYSQLRLWPSLE